MALVLLFGVILLLTPLTTHQEEINGAIEDDAITSADNTNSIVQAQPNLWVGSPWLGEIDPNINVENVNDNLTIQQASPNKVDEGYVLPKYYCVWGDYVFTQDEYELLLTTTFCESGNQDLITQQMTALVILNRLMSGEFGETLYEVIYAPDAFAVTKWPDFENRGWTPQVEQAVQLALTDNPHPKNMYYFRTKYYHSWAQDYMKSGDVYFSTKP